MKKSLAICIVASVALLDLVSFVLLFLLMAVNYKRIKNEVISFVFGRSMFDLVIWSLIRVSILFGACIGVLCNDIFGVQRIRKTSKLIVYLSCAISVYIVIKIMYFTEYSKGNMRIRDWVMISLSLVTCVTQYGCWKLLGAVKVLPTPTGSRSVLINENQDDISSESGSSSSTDSDNEDSEKNLNEFDKKEAEKYSTSSTVIKLLKLSKDDIPYIFLAFLFLTCCSIGQIFLPYYTGQVVNYIIIEKSLEKFKEAIMYVALITLATGFASGMRAGLFTFVFARYVLRVQNLLFKRILCMEIGFFDIRKTGEITSRLTSDCTKLGDSVGLNVNVFMRNVVKIIGILFFMIKISWKLSIVTLVSIPVIAIISEAFGEQYRELSEKVQNSLAIANESAEEAISNIRTVRSFAAESEESDRYFKLLNKTYALRKKESILLCGYRWSTEITDLAMSILVLYYGGHLVLIGDLSGGNLVSFILYSIEIGFCIEEIGDVYTGLMEAVGASKNILVYIERKPEVRNDGNVCPAAGIKGNIQFKDVSFAYPSRNDISVLNKINFTASPGEVVALCGPSGGGKTSIVNLLEHFYEPTDGKILIDNVNLKDYEHKYIHSQLSMVQQEPVLFARTIAENISYGMVSNVDKDLVKQSAILANAHNFIEEMPKNYSTETGEKGIQLSGGQKQRVAIARALIRNPSILILDEATSALDSESEYLVQQAINKNLKGRTVIVIAHRLSTIEKADKILVIDKGEIVEVGNHSELISKDGVYAGLVKRQLLGLDEEGMGQSKEVRINRSFSIEGNGSNYSGSPSRSSLNI